MRPAKPTTERFSIAEALARANAHWTAGQAGPAELLCQRVLAVWPGQPDALHLMGLMAHAYGNLGLAISHLRQACQAPRAPALYASNLAEMCRQSGLLAEGEVAGRRAVAMDANLPGGWNNLGIILQESGKFEESRQCLERVLALQPENAEAHNNLGNTHRRLGHVAEALSCWSKAISLNPDYAEPHSNLANLLLEQMEYEKAVEHARCAIALNPRLADAYINLAGIETARNRHDAALRWLDNMLSFAPDHATGLAARALVLKKLDRLDAALDSANRALAAAPKNAEAHNAQGLVLQAMGNFEAALAAYDRAAALPGVAAEQALINRGIHFTEHGQKAQANDAFEHAIALFPGSASARFNQADLKKFVADDPAMSAMEAMLDAADASHADRLLLHFALGKAYLDTGDDARAFAHLDAGNAMKRNGIDYDPAATEGWMRRIADVFTPALLHRPADQGDTGLLPVFVLGMPRSGTTLVEQILASHPAIHGAGELSYIQSIIDRLGGFPEAVADLTPAQLRGLGDDYLRKLKPGFGKRLVIDKMPINFAFAGIIRMILPQARIIHCRRDPADTCLSCYSKLFSAEQLFSYDQRELGRFYLGYRKLMAHWRAVLPATHFLDVDYEAVAGDTQTETRRMLAFLELDWDPACLDFHNTQRIVRTASVNQVREPAYSTSIGRWRRYERHLKPLLAALENPMA